MADDVPRGSARRLVRLFGEFFKIALFVVGGGYAIAAVADEVFGRKLKWLDEGEIIDHMPIISTVPGLVAGNTAIYTGLKVAGRLGALVSLVAVALPSCVIFMGVTLGFAHVPQGSPWLEGAFLGLRSALTGVIAGTIWKTLRRGPVDWSKGAGVMLAPLSWPRRLAALAVLAAALASAAFWCREVLLTFLGFGCICIGGGFPLVPFYFHVFVGPDAPLVQMTPEDFSNLMAFTQMTPGPVSVNAATFFGFRLAGVIGGVVATAALLTPSYFLMTATLAGLARGRTNRVVHAIVWCLKPVAVTLMGIACWRFAAMCIWSRSPEGTVTFHPIAIALTLFAGVMLVRGRLSIMALIFICAVLGCGTAVLPF